MNTNIHKNTMKTMPSKLLPALVLLFAAALTGPQVLAQTSFKITSTNVTYTLDNLRWWYEVENGTLVTSLSSGHAIVMPARAAGAQGYLLVNSGTIIGFDRGILIMS